MTHQTNEETMPHTLAQPDGDTPPARKRAAKKAAAKTATTKTAAKKTTVKKAAAKETAVKKSAVKKVAASANPVAPELPVMSPPVSKPEPGSAPAPEASANPPARAPRPKKAAAVAPAEAPLHAPAALASDDVSRRFGRVPGGGPIAKREAPAQPQPDSSRADEAAAHQPATPHPPAREESTPFPQPAASGQEGQQRNPQNREGQGQDQGQPQRESRSKRRREKRKRRANERVDQGGGPPQGRQNQHGRHNQPGRQRHEGGGAPQGQRHERERDERPVQLSGPKIDADGMLELAPKGFGFLRIPGKNFEQARDDVFVTPEIIGKFNLRVGQWIHGVYQEGPRGPQLVEISQINGMTPAEASKLPHFDELKAINPTRRISFETTPERFTTRVIDIMAPVGRGQRGLIVSPPRSGKTTILLHMAEAIREKYDEAIHLMVVLVDERPEEVTEFRRALPGAEIYASSNDEQPRNHCRIAELAIERAKRLVEAGQDVFLLMDSITRLARAYNSGMSMNSRGRGTGSGGITIGALEMPRRLFAAARNTRGGGSLTILATALIQTNSRADEAIYMEFKGTGNMELVLDRKIAENYIYPAVDIFKSGTRREELLLPDHMLHKIHLIRRGLSGHRPAEAMERLLFFLKKFPNNPQMLMEIKG
ncbi:MAG: transcription termination factor Rho [Akkermansiaceae bacterium]